MSTMTNDLLGVLHPDGSLELTGKLTVPPGRVRVRVESLEPQPPSDEGLVEFVQCTRRELQAAGHRFRTQEEIDAELEELRSDWDRSLDQRDQLREQPSAKEQP
jgi:hypothetical protein